MECAQYATFYVRKWDYKYVYYFLSKNRRINQKPIKSGHP